MIKEIKVGDYIEKSELDTEQKYNDVVEVFEQWGFKRYDRSSFESSMRRAPTWEHLAVDDCGDFIESNSLFSDSPRKLTYDQVMQLKKVDVDNCNIDKLVSVNGPFQSNGPFKPKSNRVSTVNRDLEGQMAGKPPYHFDESISVQYLNRCKAVQLERGELYGTSGEGERSFAAVAAMFNAATGKDLKGSDICLIQDCLKVVRQYSDPSRIHDDSLLDKVSYSALWAEELTKELGELNGEVK